MPGAWYRSLQLTRDPLAVPGRFFPGGGRRRLLQEAVQHLHFGGGCVALVGEPGSGVSTFLAEAREQLQEVADIAWVDADTNPGPDRLAAILGDAMGVRATAAVDELVSAWYRLRPDDGSELPLVVLVDSATLLSDTALDFLLRVHTAAHGALRLLLGGEPALLQRLSGMPVRWLCLHLPALDRDAVADYVLTRLQAAGYQGPLPLDAMQLDALLLHSGGRPGRIDTLVPRLLEEPPPAVASPGRRLPLVHMLAVAGLLAGLAVAALYWGTGDAPTAVSPGKPAAGPDVPATESAEASASPAAESAAAENVVTSAADTGSEAGTETVPVATPDAADDGAELAGDTAAEPEAGPEPGATAEPAAESGLGAGSEPTAARGPGAIPESSENPGRAELSADEKALLQLPRDAYMLQLFGARDADRARDFAAGAPAGWRVYQYETRLGERPWFVVVTGPFASRDSAQKALEGLPEALRGADPWPRPAADIAAAVRTWRGGDG